MTDSDKIMDVRKWYKETLKTLIDENDRVQERYRKAREIPNLTNFKLYEKSLSQLEAQIKILEELRDILNS